MSNIPPKGRISKFHTNTIQPPEIMPVIAAILVTLFQNKEKSMMGPNVAPKPAQAKETTLNITLFSSKAIIIATSATIRRVILETIKTCLSVASFLIIP